MAFYSALGMVSFLAFCSNVPISAIIIAMELFEIQVGIYVAIAIGISYIIVGYESIYSTQLIIYSKTPSISINADIEISDVKEQKISGEKHILKRFFSRN